MVIYHSEIFCSRCNIKVYPVDKIGPLKGAYFHHQCFKCRVCGLSLNMKNFIQNQLDPDDKEVYCNNHVPKSLAGHVGGDALGIRSALQAPKKATSYNEQIRGCDKYNPDTQAVEIQNALINLRLQKNNDRFNCAHRPDVEEKSSDNVFQVDSHNINKLHPERNNNIHNSNNYNPHGKNNIQPTKLDFRNQTTEFSNNNHNFNHNSNFPVQYNPKSNSPTKESKTSSTFINNNKNGPILTNNTHHNNKQRNIPNGDHSTSRYNIKTADSPSPSDDTTDYEHQIDLEKRLRAEEDEMYATFAHKRQLEESHIDARFKDEYNHALSELHEKFNRLASSGKFSPPPNSDISEENNPTYPAKDYEDFDNSPKIHNVSSTHNNVYKKHGTSSNLSNSTNTMNNSTNGKEGSTAGNIIKRKQSWAEYAAKEERDLERKLTLKRDKEKDALSRKLLEFERAEAARLIEKHAQEMLKFTTLKRKKVTEGKRRAESCFENNGQIIPPFPDPRNTFEINTTNDLNISDSSTFDKRDMHTTSNNNKIDHSNNMPNNKQSQVVNSNKYGEHQINNNTQPTNNAKTINVANDVSLKTNNTTPINTNSTLNSSNANSLMDVPSPRPPKCPKHQVYSDPTIFEQIDQRAINVALTNQNSFTDLVRQLTKHCSTDVQKARALFRWITIKNLNRINFDETDIGNDTPMGLLRGIKLGTESYHMLFKRLCSYAGLYCIVIRGYSKSAGYLPGMKFEDDLSHDGNDNLNPTNPNINSKRFCNTWNAAYLDGSWRFIQCNWGARHLVNNSTATSQSSLPVGFNSKNLTNYNHVNGDDQTNNRMISPSTNTALPCAIRDNDSDITSASANNSTNNNLRYEYDDHYFLTDPEEFIYEFFPKQNEWQLLDQPITLQQFENLPFVRSLFFKYGLAFVDSANNPTIVTPAYKGKASAILVTDNTGAANLSIRMPTKYVSTLVFHYNLRFYACATSNDGTSSTGPLPNADTIDGINMRRYVMQTLIGNCVVFKIHCPCKGEFLLDVFANQVDSSDYASGRAMRFKSVCKAKILCRILDKIMIPLPDCASGEWGPVKAYKLFSMVPLSHEDAVINTQESTFTIRFKFASQVRRKLVDFAAALHKNEYDHQTICEKVEKTNDGTAANNLSKCVVPKWIYTSTTKFLNNHDKNGASNIMGRLNGSPSTDLNNGIEGISFEITLPEEGQYGLDIYAREENNSRIATSPVTGYKDKQLLTHACKYLINYRLL